MQHIKKVVVYKRKGNTINKMKNHSELSTGVGQRKENTEKLTYHTFAKLLPQKPEPPGKMSRRRLRDSISRRLENDLGI